MVHVLDTLRVVPGHLGEVSRRVHADYEPVMATLAMQLRRKWIAPAVELLDRPTELVLLWELPDVPAFWRMRTTAARDPRVTEFWEGISPLLAGRERKLMCDPDDGTVLR